MRDIKLITDVKNNRMLTGEILKYKDIAVPFKYGSDGMTKGINKYSPRALFGAIIHDYACETGIVSWKVGAQYARELWKLNGCTKFQVWRWYNSVRVYGFVKRKK